ncbi:MAG TPA: PKD domain-containing protein, partial [Saprospiraceae bacterium]|nr:PKD domain-containing protein [Saprospiraceae bacterium]
TGLITGTPTIQGQFVLGVCIREYRNGELLTETRRDFQFNVTYCEPKVFAKLQADSSLSGKEFVINLCGRQSLDFQNLSTDENFISSYKWTFLINGSEVTNSNRNARFTFPGLGTYKGKMVLNESTSCADSAFLTVNVFPGINAGYRFDYDTCVPGPIRFTDQSQSGSGNLTSWSWDFSGNGTSAIRNPVHQFLTPGNKQVRLTVRDINGCRADTLATIPYYPVPPLLIVDPDVVSGCTPVKVCFRNLSVPLDTSYDIRWDFGDGITGLGLSPCHEYRNGGLYTVKLQVTSPIGCYTERTYPDWIDVRQSPEAQFDSDPEELSSLNPTALFTDQSIFANSREWTFNDRDKSIQTGVQYTFRDTGLQKVQLIAMSTNGCRDTLIRYVDVEPIVTFFMPNAFTPNGDSKNDEFLGAGYTNGMLDFEMSIWSRWGSRIFSTGDPLQGWNGRYENSGNPLPNGVYAFVVRYLTPRDKLVTIKGFVTLIR